MNEVATDYNAGFTSALVRLYQEFGGTPLASFPVAEQPDMAELTVETELVADQRETRVKATIFNKSAFPARALTTAKFRYYFTRDDAGPWWSPPATPRPARRLPPHAGIRRPLVRRGRLHRLHHRTGRPVPAPDGSPVQGRRRTGGTWNASNDPSFTATVGQNANVPLYVDGAKVWGNEPGPSTPDTTAPSIPGTPVASNITATGVTLTWTASTDTGGSGLAGYNVYRRQGTSDSLLGSAATNTFAVTGLTAATQYQFVVRAKDNAGNLSATSAAVTVTTAATGDTTAPSVPGTPVASNITATGATLTWAASTDTGGSGLAGYDVYRRVGSTDTLVGQPTSATLALTGLTPSTAYQYVVRARDGAGNVSALSAAVTFTTSGGGTGSGCSATYTTAPPWSGGFQGEVTVRNTGTASINGWTVAWTFPNGQVITQIWGGVLTQTGAAVSVSNVSYNGVLAPNGSTTFGFLANWSGTNGAPTNVSCTAR